MDTAVNQSINQSVKSRLVVRQCSSSWPPMVISTLLSHNCKRIYEFRLDSMDRNGQKRKEKITGGI